MDVIDELFSDANAVATHDVAAAFDMSENEARDWASELGVARIGASFAWTRVDVEELQEQLDAEREAEGPEDDESSGPDEEEEDE